MTANVVFISHLNTSNKSKSRMLFRSIIMLSSSMHATAVRMMPAIGVTTVSERFLTMLNTPPVPLLRSHTDHIGNLFHLIVDSVKQPAQIADNAGDQQLLEPFRNLHPQEIQRDFSFPKADRLSALRKAGNCCF